MADDVQFQRQSQVVAENSSKLQVMFAWTFVLVPLFWGITQTLIKSATLLK
ncbi:MAG: oxalate:formate antiporter [Gemmatimonadaceae bacterium]